MYDRLESSRHLALRHERTERDRPCKKDEHHLPLGDPKSSRQLEGDEQVDEIEDPVRRPYNVRDLGLPGCELERQTGEYEDDEQRGRRESHHPVPDEKRAIHP